MLAIGQLGRQSEITAMRCSGISLFRIMVPVLWLAVFLSVAAYLLDEYLVPNASSQASRLRDTIDVTGDQTVTNIDLKHDVFFRNQEGMIVYAESLDTKNHNLSQLLVFETVGSEPGGRNWSRITIAPMGRFEGDELVLNRGRTFLYDENGELKGRDQVDEIRKPFPRSLQELHETKRDASTLAGGEIAEQIARAQETGQSPVEYQTDLQFKYSIPVACLIFSLVGFVFSVYSPRKETFMGMLYAIILVLVYYVFISVFKSLGKQGIIPYPVVSAWTTNVVYLIFGSIVFARTRR
jgi:lipopolysaccharide export LptBFGC system permease protein LptF